MASPLPSDPGRTIAIIVAVVVVAGIGFFGGRYLMHWHENEMQTAFEETKEKYEKQNQQLKRKVDRLEQDLAEKKPPGVPEKRMNEVFGKSGPEASGGDAEKTGCAALEKKLSAFFDYLDQKGVYPASAQKAAPDTAAVFDRMVKDLAENPPIVVGETRDIVSLVHNQAHFFRTLNKERINMVRNILSTEADVLEPAMANFYAYYVREGCCRQTDRTCMDLPVLYEYAGFFLHTLSGSGYLMRRDSAVRNLSRYYSVLIVNRANQENINRHGIDIRPHIEATLADLRDQDNLQFQNRYIEKLKQLKRQYRQ